MKILFYLSLPLAILFAYSGLVKGLDIHLFQTQLGKSPLIPPPFVPLISYVIPILELVTAVSFFTTQGFRWAAYTSLALMAFFSFYLLALVTLFPSDDIPCSCGGILGHMSYSAHIYFNISFTLLAGYICWRLQKQSQQSISNLNL